MEQGSPSYLDELEKPYGNMSGVPVSGPTRGVRKGAEMHDDTHMHFFARSIYLSPRKQVRTSFR